MLHFLSIRYIIYPHKRGESILYKNKIKALELLEQKNKKELIITYETIALETGYSRMQLSRLAKEIKKGSK